MTSIGIMRVGPPDGVAPTPPLTLGRLMEWLLLLGSLFWPRAIIVSFWIFGSTLGDAFRSWVVPAIGFVIAPWTTMSFALMWGLTSDGVFGIEWLAVAGAVFLDLATYVGGRRMLKG